MAASCPIAGCDESRKDDRLLCLHHWRRVPKEIQRRVWSTARAMLAESEAGGPAYREWRAVRDEAIAAVEMKEAAAEAAGAEWPKTMRFYEDEAGEPQRDAAVAVIPAELGRMMVEALRQIQGRAQAIPENQIGNDIEDLARAVIERYAREVLSS